MTDPVPAPIHYRFERADLWRLGQMLYRPSLKGRLLRLGFILLCIVVGVLLGIGRWPTEREWTGLLRSPIVLAPIAVLILLSQFSHYFNVVAIWARFRHLAMADKIVTLTFGEDAIEADVAGTQSKVPWGNFVRRVEENDRVFLKIGRWEALTVPRRAFPDEAAYRAAVAFLKEKVPHGPS